MKKLAIITRDGLAYHNFIKLNNLLESDCIRIKRNKKLPMDIRGYVIIPPHPSGFNEIMEYLEILEFPNLTNKYKY